MNIKPGTLSIFLLVCFFSLATNSSFGQTPKTLKQAIEMGLANNPGLKGTALAIDRAQALQKTAFDVDKTQFNLSQDPTAGGSNDNSIGVSQTFSFPSVYSTHSQVLSGQRKLAERTSDISKLTLIRDISLAYYELAYSQKKILLLKSLDSIYSNFDKQAELRYHAGETSYLEKLTAQTRQKEIRMQQKQAAAALSISQTELQKLTGTTEKIVASEELKTTANGLPLIDSLTANPLVLEQQQLIDITRDRILLERRKLLPDITLGYSHQLLIKGFNPANINREYFPGTRIAGLQLGIGIPLIGGSQKARIKAANIEKQIAEANLVNLQNSLHSDYIKQFNEVSMQYEALQFYQSSALNEASEMLRISQFAYEKGEIGYVELLQNITQAINIRLGYLESLRQYNHAIVQYNYLKGNL